MGSMKCIIVLVFLSCSQKSEGFFGGWRDEPDVPKIEFLLYTKGNTMEEVDPNYMSTITDSSFIKGAKTLFLIHGFSDHGESEWIQAMKDELLTLSEDVNVIIVNWKKGANVFYLTAVDNVQLTADSMVKLIRILANQGEVAYSNFHLIGHSLGAQIAGRVGHAVHNIGRITGLDPASFRFARQNTVKRLDTSDADFVDIIHTDDGDLYKFAFGYMPGVTVGHADFYPNGGKDQPDCPNTVFDLFTDIFMGQMQTMTKQIACSHMRAAYYFTSSINTCAYPVHSCPNGNVVSGACMGYHASPTLRGKFCLETSGIEPFCANTGKLQADKEKSAAESAMEKFLQYLYSNPFFKK